MAVSKKGSRNITVSDHDFKWRATGNDDGITILVWPVSNEDSLVVATVDYYHDMNKVAPGHYGSQSQLVVTNRMIRELILHVGLDTMLKKHGQIDAGKVEEFYDVSKAQRG